MLHVPYDRTRAINDLMGGRLSMMFATIPSPRRKSGSGQVRALAVTGSEPLPAARERADGREAGLPGYEAGQWLGVLAPAATPQGRRTRSQCGGRDRAVADPATSPSTCWSAA